MRLGNFSKQVDFTYLWSCIRKGLCLQPVQQASYFSGWFWSFGFARFTSQVFHSNVWGLPKKSLYQSLTEALYPPLVLCHSIIMYCKKKAYSIFIFLTFPNYSVNVSCSLVRRELLRMLMFLLICDCLANKTFICLKGTPTAAGFFLNMYFIITLNS